MLQKTEMSEASTAIEQRVTSLYTARSREMFRAPKKGEELKDLGAVSRLSKDMVPNDLLYLEPSFVSSLAWPQIHYFENDYSVCVRGNFYEVRGMRSKVYLQRSSQLNAQLLHFQADKPARQMTLATVERYHSYPHLDDLWLHFNLTKYDPETQQTICNNFRLNCQQFNPQTQQAQIWDFCDLQLVQNTKKGLIIVRAHQKSGEEAQALQKVVLADLSEKRKPKDDQPSRSELQILTSCSLVCQNDDKGVRQRFIKTLKSQFGDIVMMVTNRDIYEVEPEQIGDRYKVTLKSFKANKVLGGRKGEEGISGDEAIVDCQFMSNGLKIMVLTTADRLLCFESQNFLFANDLRQVLQLSHLEQKYHLSWIQIEKVYSVNGTLALEFKSCNGQNIEKKKSETDEEESEATWLTKGLILLRAQNGVVNLQRCLRLPLASQDIQELVVQPSASVDEVIIQHISKKDIHTLEVIRYSLLANELNATVPLSTEAYTHCRQVNSKGVQLLHPHPYDSEKTYHSSEMPMSSRVFFLLNDRQLTCLKLFKEIDIEKINRSWAKLLNHSFFEKALKVSVSPLTHHFAILFKQFVKFYHFNYSEVHNYYTLKIKNVSDVKYTAKGDYILVSIEDKMHILDPYSFQSQAVIDAGTQIAEAQLIDTHHLLLKSSKNILSWWEKDSEGEWERMYDVRLEDGDCYCADLKNLIIVRRKARLQVYSHKIEPIDQKLPSTDIDCLEKLRLTHAHLSNSKKCPSFTADEHPTYLMLSQELGFLFLGTNKGSVKQYIHPLPAPTDPSPPEVLTQQVSNCKIIGIHSDACHASLYAISEDGNLNKMQVRQVINGQIMAHVFLFSHKTRGMEQEKREFTDRTYLIDHYTPTETTLTIGQNQNAEELEFLIDKLKDDIEEMSRQINGRGRQQQGELKTQIKKSEAQVEHQIKEEEERYKDHVSEMRREIDTSQAQQAKLENEHQQKYHKALLELYKESDRLKKIKKEQDIIITKQRQVMRKELEGKLKVLEQEKKVELTQLEAEYKKIETKRRMAQKENEILDQQQEAQMQLYKLRMHQDLQNEKTQAEDLKERLLGENTKKEKAINNLKHRSNYFENLILETKVQIGELEKDKTEYEKKKGYLGGQLRDKEEVIEKIERQLMQYLKNTEDMKTIKNTHEFELQEYEAQVTPIARNFRKVEDNVKHMNQEIMKEYTHKMDKQDQIQQKQQHINALKNTKRAAVIKKLETVNKVTRMVERMAHLARHPFDGDVKAEVRGLLEGEEAEALGEGNEMQQREKRKGEGWLRAKHLIRKQIEEEEKKEEHIYKNQHQFYVHHNENTALVRQFNDLKKAYKQLTDRHKTIVEKVEAERARHLQHHTPLRRMPSLNLKKSSEKKLTPFQRYEQETARKQQDTIDTRPSRKNQSLSFLKGLMKEVGQTDSHHHKQQIMRERVRTFVNPQLKAPKPQELKRLVLGRSRGTSEMLKLH